MNINYYLYKKFAKLRQSSLVSTYLTYFLDLFQS